MLFQSVRSNLQAEADTPVGDIVRIGPIFFPSEIPPPFPLLNVPFEPFFTRIKPNLN